MFGKKWHNFFPFFLTFPSKCGVFGTPCALIKIIISAFWESGISALLHRTLDLPFFWMTGRLSSSEEFGCNHKLASESLYVLSLCLLIIRMEIHPGKTNLDICSIKKFIHQTRHLKFSINLKWILMLENVRNATLPTKAHIWTMQLKRHISWFILTYKRQLWAVFHYGLNAL